MKNPELKRTQDRRNYIVKLRALCAISISILLFCGCCSIEAPKTPAPLSQLSVCPGTPRQIGVLFNNDGHMYTTFLVASFTELPIEQAYAVTYYSQLPDLDCRFDATHVSLVYALVPWQWSWRADITEQLHSLHGGNNAAVQRRRWFLGEMIRRRMRNPTPDDILEAGLLIHAFGDSYAHTDGAYNSGKETAYGTVYGHALKGHHPDEIAHPDVFSKYEAYVRHLFHALDTQHKPEREKLMEDYLCSLKTYYACTNELNCDAKAIEKMEAAITTWSRRVPPGFDKTHFEQLLKTPPLPKSKVLSVIQDIKRGPF